jgi:hypothetical protein
MVVTRRDAKLEFTRTLSGAVCFAWGVGLTKAAPVLLRAAERREHPRVGGGFKHAEDVTYTQIREEEWSAT